MIKPTYSNESEVAVIASVLEDSSCMSKISFLTHEDFYINANKLLYKLIESDFKKGSDVDLYSIGDRVTDEMGGIAYLADIVKNNATPRNVVSYAKRVVDMAIRRKTVAAYSEAIDSLQDPNQELLDNISKVSDKVDSGLSRLAIGDVFTIDTLINKTIQEMDLSLQEARLGISSGIEEVDIRLGYKMLAVGEITYLGAQSKNGKTLFANTIAARCDLQEDECCHIFSIEMPAIGMFNGVVSAMSGVPSNFYARQNYYQKVLADRYTEWMSKWGMAAQELNQSDKVTIDDRKDVTMSYVCAEMRKHCQLMENKGKKLKLVIIDHLHRISFDTSTKSMTYAMGDDVRMLKNTAAELGIAVLLLGQLNEGCKDRDPTAFDILDTARVRHEIQAFIGTRIFRQNGGTYFGVYSDAHRYADHETRFDAGYMKLIGGVLKSLGEGEYFTPDTGID